MGAAPRLHLQGVLLPDGERCDLWVCDGLIHTDPVADAVTICREAWILPGLVDAHCHVGLGASGAVTKDVAEQQAVTDRTAGTLLIRDAGSPVDTHWIDERLDLPRIIRAGRHIARPKRYIRNYAAEVEPEDLIAEVARQAVRGDGWVKLVGDWIDRDAGDLSPLWPADVAAAASAVPPRRRSSGSRQARSRWRSSARGRRRRGRAVGRRRRSPSGLRSPSVTVSARVFFGGHASCLRNSLSPVTNIHASGTSGPLSFRCFMKNGNWMRSRSFLLCCPRAIRPAAKAFTTSCEPPASR